MDQVFIYAQLNLREDREVSIGSWVREPGVYPYSRDMTVKDLVRRAGPSLQAIVGLMSTAASIVSMMIFATQ